jgi:hypothetical protein
MTHVMYTNMYIEVSPQKIYQHSTLFEVFTTIGTKYVKFLLIVVAMWMNK